MKKIKNLKLSIICFLLFSAAFTSCIKENNVNKNMYEEYEVLDLTIDPMFEGEAREKMIRKLKPGEYRLERLEQAGVFKVQFRNDDGDIYWKVGILEAGTEIIFWLNGRTTVFLCWNGAEELNP